MALTYLVADESKIEPFGVTRDVPGCAFAEAQPAKCDKGLAIPGKQSWKG